MLWSDIWCCCAAFCEGELVGAIACRLEHNDGSVRLHIATLGVLAAFRSKGIGARPCFASASCEYPTVASYSPCI